MVAVQVRDEHGAQFQRVDPAADQLLLYPLSRIDQIVLLVHIDRLGRRMAAQSGLGGGRSEYGDAETHAGCLFLFALRDSVYSARLRMKRSQSIAAMQPDAAAVMACR